MSAFASKPFGNLTGPCTISPLLVCAVAAVDVQTLCLAKGIGSVSTLLVQNPGTIIIDVLIILECVLFAYQCRNKFVTVGQVEMSIFFEMVCAACVFEFVLYGNWLGAYPTAVDVITSIYLGILAATYFCLAFNGFVGFQFLSDGQLASLLSLCIGCLACFVVALGISLDTSFGWTSTFSRDGMNPGMYFMYIIWPAICVVAYLIPQMFYISVMSQKCRVTSCLIIAVLFFAMSQVFLLVINEIICTGVLGYIDGVFLGQAGIAGALAALFLYYQMITRDD